MPDARLYIELMAKHLPPSAATLRLLDVGNSTGPILADTRGDVNIVSVNGPPAIWQQSNDSVDAVMAYDCSISPDFLHASLSVLRPGGRLVIAHPSEHISKVWVTTLESAGFTRILVEPALEGVLIRGEKPHTEQQTQERIQQVASYDADLLNPATYNGRYVHLLICQTPNKPIWKLAHDEHIEWQAVAILQDNTPVILAFSSLPKAVAFMQPSVLAGRIKDVNKVGKFSRETAQGWTVPVILNPTMDYLEARTVMLLPVDPHTAQAPDE